MGNLPEMQLLGRLRRRWEDNVIIYLDDYRE
jgi:hypothetical protein